MQGALHDSPRHRPPTHHADPIACSRNLQYKSKAEELKKRKAAAVAARYGTDAAKPLPRSVVAESHEGYVEYAADGSVKGSKGARKAAGSARKSRYDEDVFPGNHTSVWGSYWRGGEWGYACCHSLQPAAYCTGAAGRDAAHAIADSMQERVKALGEREQLIAPGKAEKVCTLPCYFLRTVLLTIFVSLSFFLFSPPFRTPRTRPRRP